MTMANKVSPGQRMIASAKQALAFAEGEDNGSVVHIPEEIDVARIRGKVGMSQRRFAAYFGVSVRTIQEWEQGRAVPSGPARALLIVIDREPNAVRRALARAQRYHSGFFLRETAPCVTGRCRRRQQ
jgi:putative transcriptional regulator